MSMLALFSKLNRQGIKLQLVDNNLKISGPQARLTPDLVKELKEKKEEITRFLRRYVQTQETFIAIEPVENKQYYILSSAQQRLYILQQMDANGTGYNLPAVFLIEGKPERKKFEKAFRDLIARHESLRTSFRSIEGKPVQEIHDQVEFEMEYYRVEVKVEGEEEPFSRLEGTRGLAPLSIDPATRSSQPATALINSFIRPFDLTRAPLFRAGVIKLLRTPSAHGVHPRRDTYNSQDEKEDKYLLMVDMHHIISDGTSLGIIAGDFMSLYAGEKPEPLRLQYKDYSHWQHKKTGEAFIKQQESFWLDQFSGEIPVLNLPLDDVRPVVQDFTGKALQLNIDKEETHALTALAAQEGITLYMLLLSLYTVLLSKLSGQEEIVVGTPTAGRSHEDLRPLVGMFVNTLALRLYPAAGMPFQAFLGKVKETTLAAFANQDYQFERLVELLPLKRDTGRNPLFDTMFALQNLDIPVIEIPGLLLKSYPFELTVSKFDLVLECFETGEGLTCQFEYCTRLFKQETIERFARYFKKIISTVTGSPGKQIAGIEMLPETEKKQLIIDFNDTEEEFPADKTIYRLFMDQVVRIPRHTAAVGQEIDHVFLTYEELNKKSNQLARVLQEKGLRAYDIAAIMMERSVEMVIAVLGILETGAAYLPIEPGCPAERLDFMLKDSGAKILLKNNDFTPEALNNRPGDASSHPHLQPAPGTFLAYIIYTSGSTGIPKGVMVNHRPVINLLTALFKKYPVSPEDTYLLKTSYVFDVSVTELFGWFLGGGRLAVLEREGEKSPQKILDTIENESITHINFVPSMFGIFIEALTPRNKKRLSRLKYIFLAGETLLPGLVEKFNRLDVDVVLENLYGPTEAAIYASSYALGQWPGRGSIPIGKPLPNVKLHILDRYNCLCPLGVVGELCISGTGLARGYLNNPTLTARKFRKYRSHRSYKSYILYKTGDLARWLPNGNIEFLGRIDHQLKIRGFRIELGEIENRLLKHESIKEAVVTAKEDETRDRYLSAYVVTDLQEDLTVSLKNYLSGFLPDYMIPSYFMGIENIPLTPGGKVNRQALPDPELKRGNDYTAPRDRIEEKLVELWAAVLGRKKETIGIHDNFFRLGGHSLKATILAAKIHKALDVNVSLAGIFKTPSISALAANIRKTAAVKYIALQPTEIKEYYAVSPAQKRLFILQQMELDNISYNMPLMVPFPGEIDKERLEWTFNQLIHRHDSLRTSFEMIDTEPVQEIHEEVEFEIEYYDLQVIGAGDRCRWGSEGTGGLAPLSEESHLSSSDVIRHLSSGFIRPFDLTRAPLLRVGLIQNLLLVDLHHIITDGTSQVILKDEFQKLYTGEAGTLPPIRLQYKDYAQWLCSEEQQTLLHRQETYWLKEFADEVPVLNLSTDFPRPAVQSFAGKTEQFPLTPAETRTLKTLALEVNATLFMSLLSVFAVLLSKLSGQEDIIIGTPTAGRRHADLEKIIGMFVNTLPLRINTPGEMKYKEFLKELKERVLAAFENQEYPFEELVEKVSVRRDAGRNPIFDVMFNLMNIEDYTLDFPGQNEQRPNRYQYQEETAKFDITLAAVEIENSLLLSFQYCTRLFEPKTIHRFTAYFKRILQLLAADSNRELSSLEIITETEKHRLLYEFNDTRADYPKEKTIHELFKQQVKKIPDHIAVIGPRPGQDRTDRINRTYRTYKTYITYRELDETSTGLAGLLQEQGISPDSIVGLMVEPCIHLITGIIGILKAGGAYLPINPTLPPGRAEYILKDSAISILLTQSSTASDIAFNGTMISLDREDIYKHKQPDISPGNDSHPNHLVYVIYTSGSTGWPKGTAVEHAQLVNFVYHMYNRYNGQVDVNDSCLSLTNMMFDVSVWEYFLPIVFGAQLVLLPEKKRFDVSALAEAILREAITLIYLPPGLLKDINEELKKERTRVRLNKMLVGVEPIRDEVLEGYMRLNPAMKIINGYGPTETTICATSYNYPPHEPRGEIVPIGTPLSNNQVLLLDTGDHIVPRGIPGEICISGDGVSRGYINNPELTAEKFQIHKEASYNKSYRSYKSYILYKTGDLGLVLPDGNIRFIGRRDQQVKIRGYRVELGEIEKRLLKHRDIKQALVLVKTGESIGKYICAYVVPDKNLEISGLRKYLSRDLPDYMIPSYFVPIDKIPLTPNGKIDYGALPGPGLVPGIEEYRAPRDLVEEKLVKIWAEVLAIEKEKISIDANFFELGGHSLKATLLTAKIHKNFEVSLPLTVIFTNPTIRELGTSIKETAAVNYTSINPTEKKEYYQVSSAQKRIYILQQLDPGSKVYNMPAVMRLEGEPDREKLTRGFRQLLTRHESLRTSFVAIQDKPVQRVHDEAACEIAYYDLATGDTGNTEGTRGLTPLPKEPAARYIKDFIRSFDLSQAPLIRAGLIKLPHTPSAHRVHPRRGTYNSQEGKKDKYLLMVDMHHIVSDGTSIAVLIKDFMALYKGEILSPPKIHYKDFSGWQRYEKQKQKLKQQESYWLKEFAGEIPVLNLPIDYSRPSFQSFTGSSLQFELEENESRALKSLTRERQVTLFMLLLGVYTTFLSKISGQEDILVGTPTAGRQHAQLENIIGMFINTLVLRHFLPGEKTFAHLLEEVKTQTLAAFENQDYPFEELVEQVEVERDASRNPMFDTMFVLQNVDIPTIEIPGLKLAPSEYETGLTKFDLTLSVSEIAGKLSFIFEYNTGLFKQESITRFIHYLKKITAAVIENDTIKLGEIDITPADEKRKILYEFNDTTADYPRDATIQQLFTRQVERTPDRTALVGRDSRSGGTRGLAPLSDIVSLTYRELNEKSRQLAAQLKEKGTFPDDIIGVILPTSIDMIISIFAILMAGAAYLPIDPDSPRDRIDFMLKDSNAKILLTKREITTLSSPQALYLSEGHHPNFPASRLPGFPASLLSRLAYIIYTSGSTGRPRGVMVDHSGLINLCTWHNRFYSVTAADRAGKYAAVGFDASVWEIFPYFLAGASLYLVPNTIKLDMAALNYFFETHGITITFLPTPICERFLEQENYSLRSLLTGGDRLKNFIKRNYQLFNNYGPTENTVVATAGPVNQSHAHIPIGKPIHNNFIFILSPGYYHIQPIGIPGELCIGGDSLARGYLNNPGLTNQKLLRGVQGGGFLEKSPPGRRRLYKTGDLALWLADGNIRFLGRIDSQVKIRGNRIELGEIENQLLAVQSIKEAVVINKKDSSNQEYLCAYIVSNIEINTAELNRTLARALPNYMLPAYYVSIDKIPLTANGKVDRKSLPDPDKEDISTQYVPPGNETEEILVKMWEEVLGITGIGIHDDFFNRGGDSLKLITLYSHINKRFPQKVKVQHLFDYRTIKELSDWIVGGASIIEGSNQDNQIKNIEF